MTGRPGFGTLGLLAFTLAAFLAAAAPAHAQRSELALTGGYTGSGEIDRKTRGVQELKIGGGFSWGFSAARFFSPNVGAELSYAQQEGALVLGTSAGSTELFDTDVGQLHANLVYQLGGESAKLRPFVFGGLGATFFNAPSLDTETKLSWSLGAGVKWFPRKSFGTRIHAAYNPTQLDDESSDFCDAFGFCQGSLKQFELMAGVVFRF